MGCTQAKPSSHAKKNQNSLNEGQQVVKKIQENQNISGKKADHLFTYRKNQIDQQNIDKNQNNNLLKNNQSGNHDLKNSKLTQPQINILNVEGPKKSSQIQNSMSKSHQQQISDLKSGSVSMSKLQSLNKKLQQSPELQIQSFKKQTQKQQNSKKIIVEQVSNVTIQKNKKHNNSFVSQPSQKHNIQKGTLNQTAFINNQKQKNPENERMIQSTGKILNQNNKAFKNRMQIEKKENQVDQSSKQDTFSTQIKKEKHSLFQQNTKIYEEEDKLQNIKNQKKQFQSLLEKPKNFEERFNGNHQIKKENKIKDNDQVQEPSERIEIQEGKINKVLQSSVPHRMNKDDDQSPNQSKNNLNLSNSKYMRQMQHKTITQVEQQKFSSHQQNINKSVSSHSASRGLSGNFKVEKQENRTQKNKKQEHQRQNLTKKDKIELDQSHYSTKPDPRVNIILFQSKNSSQSKKTVSKFNSNNMNNIINSNQKSKNQIKKYSNMSMNQSRFAKQKLDEFEVNSDNVPEQQQCRYGIEMSKVKIQVQI